MPRAISPTRPRCSESTAPRCEPRCNNCASKGSDEALVTKVKRALVSVSDKSGVVEFARALAALGVEILSTGGTARLLQKEGDAVTEESAYTGSPEMRDGRGKTLHPRIHGGLLARRARAA